MNEPLTSQVVTNDQQGERALLPYQGVNEATPNRYIVASQASDFAKIVG